MIIDAKIAKSFDIKAFSREKPKFLIQGKKLMVGGGSVM